MTSKISFFKLCRENMKRRMWLLVLTILTYFISMPLAMMIMLQNEADNRNRVSGYIEIFSDFFGMGFHSILAAGFAILCAVAGFAWLFSKKKVDMYHSMPVRREKLFAAVYLNGILVWLVPYLVSILICLPMIGSHVRISGEMASTAVITIGINILFFVFFYNLMLAAVMLTGNMINCLITGGVLFAYAVALRGLLEVYLSYFMATWYSDADILGEVKFFSPIMSMAYFADNFTKWQNHMLVYVTGGAFALYLIALILYQKRPSEAAGKSIAFEKILNIYRIMLVIPLSLGSGIFFSALVDGGTPQNIMTAWMIFGLIFGLVLSHGFIEVLFQMDIKAMFSYKRQLLATGVVVFLVAFSFKGDWYGIGRYMPQEEKVESMAITAGTDYIYYNNFETDGYLSGETYILTNMELTDTKTAYELAKLGMECTGSKAIYNIQGEGPYICYAVRYRLKSGKEITRRYWLPEKTAWPYIEQLYTQQEFKDGIMGAFWENASAATELTVMDMNYDEQALGRQWIAEFMEIYRREYESLTAEQILKGTTVAEVSYEIREYEEADSSGHVIARLGNGCIYSACTETLQFLKEHGIDTSSMTQEFDPEKVTRIELRSCSEEGDAMLRGEVTEDWGTMVIIEDRNEIEKLLPYLVSDLTRYNGFKDYDDNFDVYVVYESGAESEYEEKYQNSRYMRLKKGAPIGELKFDIMED